MSNLAKSLPILLLAACAAESATIESVGGKSDALMPLRQLRVVAPSEVPAESDPLSLGEATLRGTELSVTVSYGGGCEAHEFELYWDGMVLETFPPQINLALVHEDNDDFCEAFVTETLRFDLGEVVGLDPALLINLRSGEESTEISRSATPLIVTDFVPHHIDGYGIEGLVVRGRELAVTVSYGGGCAEHDFQLYWDGLVLESFPVQARLALVHNGNGDFCEAFITEERVFDIGELVDLQAGAEMIVNVFGPDDSAQTMLGDAALPL